ncbi:43kDa postsynaptic protein [Trema orientale]|uniref:43kDa postsynaptic protein n=1 Tax=Trema orientale TaxID=63057 RepID=A0A2P5CT41_TREOI|nr:43kDa postsynaptic protein [Trema orientale]
MQSPSSAPVPDDTSNYNYVEFFFFLWLALIFIGAALKLLVEHCCYRALILLPTRLPRTRQPQPMPAATPLPMPHPHPPPPELSIDDAVSITCTYRIEKSSTINDDNNNNSSDCSICLEDFKYGDECRMFVKCNHGFHKACVDKWLARDKHCPLCRGSIRGVSATNVDQV